MHMLIRTKLGNADVFFTTLHEILNVTATLHFLLVRDNTFCIRPDNAKIVYTEAADIFQLLSEEYTV